MDRIKQVRYNRMYCTNCGEYTSADLVGFDFSKIFALAIETQNDDTWKPLVRLNLKFYYTLRDIYQELHYKASKNQLTELKLTVGDVIKQLEFLMKPETFSSLRQSNRETPLYNKMYEILSTHHGLPEEEMDDIELLIRNLGTYKKEDVIVSVPMSFVFDKDDIQNEIPIGMKYSINNKIYFENERVCPACGMKYDVQSGYHHEFIIGLAGLARVGKTAYIASLIHQLKKYTHNDFISISLKDNSDDSFHKFNEQILKDYETGKIIKKTEVENIEEIPLVYVSVKINNKDFNFVFVDMPGEIYDYDNDDGADFVSDKRHIFKSVDMLWCFIEPSMINKRYHNLKDGKGNNRNSDDQLANLVTTLNNIHSRKIPASIIVTQSDLLKDDYPALFNPSIDVIDEYIMDDNTLNMTKMEEYEEKTRLFLKKMMSFEPTIAEVFDGYSMFSIASYGFDVNSNLLSDKVINPSMIELPFLWTLAYLGCIGITKTNQVKNVFGKEKEVFEKVLDHKELYM
jgi:hypothetical protein